MIEGADDAPGSGRRLVVEDGCQCCGECPPARAILPGFVNNQAHPAANDLFRGLAGDLEADRDIALAVPVPGRLHAGRGRTRQHLRQRAGPDDGRHREARLRAVLAAADACLEGRNRFAGSRRRINAAVGVIERRPGAKDALSPAASPTSRR